MPVDEGTASFYATVFAALHRYGRPIPVDDLWIAATALPHGILLVMFGEPFQAIEGLMTAVTPSQLLP